MPTTNTHVIYFAIKRALDFSFSLAAIVALSPLLVLITGALWISQGRPIFFVQVRPGLGGTLFKLIKFRTMAVTQNEIGDFSSVETITPMGRILRKLSADELPQLLNIMRGDMSFVGPRPLLASYLPLYSSRQSLRHTVRPGLTGLAQVNGRNSQSWDERLELDAHYAENVSWLLDLSILIRSVSVVVSGKGVSARDSELMEPFRGKGYCPDDDQG